MDNRDGHSKHYVQNDNMTTWINIRSYRRSSYDTGSESDYYTFKSVESGNTKSKTLSPLHLFSFFTPFLPSYPSCKDDSAVSQRLYFLSFLSTVVFLFRKEESGRAREAGCAVKEKEENDRRGWGREGKESGQCSRKLASKSCGRNECRTPSSILVLLSMATSNHHHHHHLLTILSLRSSESLRWREWETAAVGNEETGWGGEDGNGMEGHCRRRGGLRPTPQAENPRGNFAERTSISCIQWDIGIKRI